MKLARRGNALKEHLGSVAQHLLHLRGSVLRHSTLHLSKSAAVMSGDDLNRSASRTRCSNWLSRRRTS